MAESRSNETAEMNVKEPEFIANAPVKKKNARAKAKQYTYRVTQNTPDDIADFINNSVSESYSFPSLITDLILEHMTLSFKGEALFEVPHQDDNSSKLSSPENDSVLIKQIMKISEGSKLDNSQSPMPSDDIRDFIADVKNMNAHIDEIMKAVSESENNQEAQFKALVNGVKKIEQAKLKKYSKLFDDLSDKIDIIVKAHEDHDVHSGDHSDSSIDNTRNNESDSKATDLIADTSQYAEIRFPNLTESDDDDIDSGESFIEDGSNEDEDYENFPFVDYDSMPYDENDTEFYADDNDDSNDISAYGDLYGDDFELPDELDQAIDSHETQRRQNSEIREKLIDTLPDISPETPYKGSNNEKDIVNAADKHKPSYGVRTSRINDISADETDIISELLGA